MSYLKDGKSKLLAALAALAALGVGLVVVIDQGPGEHTRTTITVTLGGPGQTKVALPPAAQATAAGQEQQAEAGRNETDLHAEPPAADSNVVQRVNEAQTPPGQPELPATVLPDAAVSTPGCRTALVRNYSSRGGSPVLLGVIHLTVSTDNGWAGVLGNVKWFDNPAAQASSNYIVDRKVGACALAVPETQKAWTQAGFNRVSLSVEVTARGNEGSLVVPGSAGEDRLVGLLRRWHRIYRLPYRHGAVSGCAVTRTGFVMHADLGGCGGGHVDVRPYAIDRYIAKAKALDTAAHVIVAADRARCRAIHAYRGRTRHTTSGTARFLRRLDKTAALGLRCVDGKVRHK